MKITELIKECEDNKEKWYVVPDGYIGAPYYCGQGYIRFVKKVSRFLRKSYKDDEDARRFIELVTNNPTSCDEEVLDEMIECLIVLDDDKEIKVQEKRNIKIIGEGSFSNVYSYKDELSNSKLALKKLKENVEDKEMIRFKKEYEYMNELHHPNILEVYNYNENENSYYMEFCDKTLSKYVDENNNKEFMSFEYRKGMVKQLIEGMKAIHNKNLLHRDISFNNILVKEYDNNICILKISDFGIAKNLKLDLTSLGSEMKGTIIDPLLENFKKYDLKNEIYSIGRVIYFIFTGKKIFIDNHDELSKIITRCTINDYGKRYNNLNELLIDIENLTDYNKIKENKSAQIIKINKNNEEIGLNETQIEMLHYASISSGVIYFERTIVGTYISVGDKTYDVSKTKDEAYFKKYIDELLKNEYISYESKDKYKLTYKAYELVESLF